MAITQAPMTPCKRRHCLAGSSAKRVIETCCAVAYPVPPTPIIAEERAETDALHLLFILRKRIQHVYRWWFRPKRIFKKKADFQDECSSNYSGFSSLRATWTAKVVWDLAAVVQGH
jgi:hypothetical protein